MSVRERELRRVPCPFGEGSGTFGRRPSQVHVSDRCQLRPIYGFAAIGLLVTQLTFECAMQRPATGERLSVEHQKNRDLANRRVVQSKCQFVSSVLFPVPFSMLPSCALCSIQAKVSFCRNQ